ncbi:MULTISPECIES: class I SAM-dependent DNA methyltransferase [Klebsiella]|uniref:HsdM family class I SAM-dependent methyltransferase n=1 Tax=Klebsiella pneumoniae complex TaxID=3390273 RepID=UPI000E094C4D|nr:MULTISPECIES: Eco57I restriction-modification methylase domain-containing protein [Klebsiella]MDP1295141.1 Eco57I restriction-modification methylase domain-containing protein [Klebsiella quasipneumoniae]RDE39906.1 methylase [Klebsiella pneumoniae]
MNVQHFDFFTDSDLSNLERYQTCKAMAKGYASTYKTEQSRLMQARSFCSNIVSAYWDTLARKLKSNIKMRAVPHTVYMEDILCDARELAERTGELIARFPAEDAGYLIGSIYTVMLPSAYRAEMGAYYTPPPLVSRLLDLAEQSGVDFSHATVIDPACGGGAFLAPVAIRMLKKDKGSSPEWILRRISCRLKGIEIDPFAAWMSSVLLESVLMPLCVKAKRRLPHDTIIVGDALQQEHIFGYDLVIGNPPYGRVTLDIKMREKYSRSLFGHANLYGLFTDLAIRMVKENTGVIAFLTPTSFLGGQYFTALRTLLTEKTTPFAFDFVADRDGVFDDVLQETMLTAFKAGDHKIRALVSSLVPKGLNKAKIEKIGSVEVEKGGATWLLPRGKDDARFLKMLKSMPMRLAELGYSVSTGKLVWNRFKSQLRATKGKNSYPLVWAESITSAGFRFSADRKNHVPYIDIVPRQDFLVTTSECVLVQRTTSKEQERRILAAILPQKFIDENGGVVVENHINIVYSNGLFSAVRPEVIEVLLNSHVVDRAFRCISGSVAVSAYELNSIPLPSLEQVMEIQALLDAGVDRRIIERTIAGFYGVMFA